MPAIYPSYFDQEHPSVDKIDVCRFTSGKYYWCEIDDDGEPVSQLHGPYGCEDDAWIAAIEHWDIGQGEVR